MPICLVQDKNKSSSAANLTSEHSYYTSGFWDLRKKRRNSKVNEEEETMAKDKKNKKHKKRHNKNHHDDGHTSKKKKEENDDDDDIEEAMNSSLSTSRRSDNNNDMEISSSHNKKKTTKKRKKEEIPSLYKEDLGTVGVKKTTHRPILKGPQVKFNVKLTNAEEKRRKERQTRFSGNSASGSNVTSSFDDSPPDGLSSALSASRDSTSTKLMSAGSKRNSKGKVVSAGRVVGKCQNLEKKYYRLTTYPKPEDVRPLDVLKRSLAHIKNRYLQTEDFDWSNEQLKSVRQDLTVQGIKNDFVLDVYETHARILLENGDLNEFNQCQTMIRTLTTGSNSTSSNDDEGVQGGGDVETSSDDNDDIVLCQKEINEDEFGAYRLLYAMVQNSRVDVTNELINVRRVIKKHEERIGTGSSSNHISGGSSSSSSNKKSKNKSSNNYHCCKHAELVIKSVSAYDYYGFFKLYESAPHLSAYLMDFLVKRMRLDGYKRIVASYRPTVSVEHIRESLCFQDLEETRTFLKQNGAAYVVEETDEPPFWVDCKASCNGK